MTDEQCNNCGGFKDVTDCQHCATRICTYCRLNHEPYCEELQKAKRRGEGPTIGNVPVPAHRAGHETPPTTEPDRRFEVPAVEPPASQVPADMPTLNEEQVAESLRNFIDPGGLLEGMSFGLPYKAALAAAEKTDIDTAIAGIADLLADGQ